MESGYFRRSGYGKQRRVNQKIPLANVLLISLPASYRRNISLT